MISEKIRILTNSPGCYLIKDKNNNIIYIGKAKNLNKRVSQYFNNIQQGKTRKMVENIADFEVIITNNEKEALLLEANLIKKHSPYYNVLLKDDKHYPYVRVNFKYGNPKLEIARYISDNNYT